MHRVFPSSYIIIASSQLFQFRKINIGDSGAVVTPFMQDGTYPSRNFATLGPSGLRPPFTGIYKKSNTFLFHLAALGRCQILYVILYYLAKSYVFIKQSPLPFFKYNMFFLSRSYKVNLPSSFNVIIIFVFIYSTKILVLDLIL